RTRCALHVGMHVHYAQGVPERRVSREAWAEIVNDLVASEAAGVKARFARLVGVDYKTVLRWLRGDVDVSEALIRQVADRLHISPLRLLVQVGLYDPSELSPAPEPK